MLGALIQQTLQINSSHRWRLCLECSVGIAVLQQLEQPAWRDVALHFPRPERRGLCVARDSSKSVSPGAFAFDRDHLNAFTSIGLIGGTRGFAHPVLAGKYVSIRSPAPKAIPQHPARFSLLNTHPPVPRHGRPPPTRTPIP